MNKHKDKHHPPEAEAPAPAGSEPYKETAAGQKLHAAVEPAEAETASSAAEHGAKKPKKAEEEIVQLKDQLLRLRADYDNFRKRSLREKGEIYENANEALLLELLPVIDHIQLAVSSVKEHLVLSGVEGQADAAFQEGLQLIADQMTTVLAKFGLDPFNSEKQSFDPNLHEAISYLPSETVPEGVIIAQSRQGYRYKNRILRPAQVVVSSGLPVPAESETNNQPAED